MQEISQLASSVINFDVYNLPPYTDVTVFVNGINYSDLAVPDGKLVGDVLTTDSTGRAKGKILVLKSYAAQLGNELKITFKNKVVGTEAEMTYAQVTAQASGEGVVAINKDNTGPVRLYDMVVNNNGTAVPDASRRSIQAGSDTLNPVTQTFFVDASRYPQGLYLSSAELYFATKDTILPVSIEFRRLTNGLPSAADYIQGSTVCMEAYSVNVPTEPAAGIGASTKFNFAPLYFAPGEYALCVLSNSANYTLFSAKMGEGILGSGERVNKEPYTGRLFKSQNTNLWLEETSTDICFKLNKAVFATGTSTFELQSHNIPRTEYDNMYLDATDWNFGDLSKIDYTFTGKRVSDGAPESYPTIKAKTPTKLLRRLTANVTGDMKVSVTFTNKNKDISPALDKGHLSLYSFKNLIDPYDTDTSRSELSAYNGVARSKYISKAVTLEDGFDSTGLEVKLDVNRKTGTDIEVFCRVISSQDSAKDSSIEKRTWVKMPLFNQSANVDNAGSITGVKQYAGLSDEIFLTETYKVLEEDSLATTGTPNLSYTALVGDVATTFNSFNSFQIKVVFYSENTTIVPKIKNLIATAVI